MSETPICSIAISSQIPINEIESLETSLRMASIKVQKLPSRVVGVDDIMFIATVLGGLAATAQLIDYGIRISNAIIKWRHKLREKGIEPEGRLEHPERPPLDLKTATDEEIEEWFKR